MRKDHKVVAEGLIQAYHLTVWNARALLQWQETRNCISALLASTYPGFKPERFRQYIDMAVEQPEVVR